MIDPSVAEAPSVFTEEHRQRLQLRARGGRALTPQDVTEVMYRVDEIAPEVLVEIKEFFKENDIVYDDEPTLASGNGRSRAAERSHNGRTKVDHAKIAAEAMAKASGSADPVKMYLKEIGRVPLLNAAEEVSLAKRIEAGAEAAAKTHELFNNGQWQTLDRSQQRTLRRQAADGEKAKSSLTSANLRLVVSIAKRYVGRGVPILDLIQEDSTSHNPSHRRSVPHHSGAGSHGREHQQSGQVPTVFAPAPRARTDNG